jgi:hypothetical protein
MPPILAVQQQTETLFLPLDRSDSSCFEALAEDNIHESNKFLLGIEVSTQAQAANLGEVTSSSMVVTYKYFVHTA